MSLENAKSRNRFNGGATLKAAQAHAEFESLSMAYPTNCAVAVFGVYALLLFPEAERAIRK
jgi:hypothetical protein